MVRSFVEGVECEVGWLSCLDLSIIGEVESHVESEQTDLSIRRAYSSILMRLMKSSFMLSKDRRSPSSKAMRACQIVRKRGQ